MKITQDKDFNPITIILEREEEAKILMALSGSVIGGGETRKHVEGIYYGLRDLNIETGKVYFEGKLKTV